MAVLSNMAASVLIGKKNKINILVMKLNAESRLFLSGCLLTIILFGILCQFSDILVRSFSVFIFGHPSTVWVYFGLISSR